MVDLHHNMSELDLEVSTIFFLQVGFKSINITMEL